MDESAFGVGMGIGIIIGIVISMILDKWYEWKDEMEKEEEYNELMENTFHEPYDLDNQGIK